MSPAAQSRRGASRARLILPMAGLGLILACSAIMIRRSTTPSQTVSEVRRAIQEIALRGGAPGARSDAGEIGPWRIAAESVDPVSGAFQHFRLDSGPMIIIAATATLDINAEDDTFSFDMLDVVFTRVPDSDEPEDNSGVHTVERHVLGPAPYGIDIVSDGREPARRPQFDPAPSPLTDASD